MIRPSKTHPVNALREVEAAVKKLPRALKPEKWAAKNYIGGGESRLQFLDLTAPILRARFTIGFSFSEASNEVQWKIWDYIWKESKIFEVMNGAIHFAFERPIEELFAKRRVLFSWLKRSDNWAHSDSLSSIYARLLEYRRSEILPKVKAWSQHSDPWTRRQSLVSLLYYASTRMQDRVLPFPTLISFIEKQINDPHYYVQKGVGWTVRETYNLYPKETVAWLKKNIHRLSAPAWQASTEKLSLKIKSELKSQRKKSRHGKK